jgi:hypothetical protein
MRTGYKEALEALKKLDTPKPPTAKTAKITSRHNVENKNPQTPIQPTAKTAKTPGAGQLGLVAAWSGEFGYISMHDPTTGEWHDVQTGDAPGWARGEASKRKELYRAGNRKAYRLTSTQMNEIWREERSDEPVEEGIVEDHPLEDTE